MKFGLKFKVVMEKLIVVIKQIMMMILMFLDLKNMQNIYLKRFHFLNFFG